MTTGTSKERKYTVLSLVAPPHWQRLVDELALNARTLNRSALVRMALIEKADRDLPANWREQLGFTESGEAA
jgi:hypothetical protein